MYLYQLLNTCIALTLINRIEPDEVRLAIHLITYRRLLVVSILKDSRLTIGLALLQSYFK